ncbi:cyclin-dependent kinase F-4-like [Primulina huaijiensis]|uniref:cyclin-dependent kinase F-4-like n=1 Tax=Primulina huaijiensis TaxID=1492673 RepID=UPI003CC6F636
MRLVVWRLCDCRIMPVSTKPRPRDKIPNSIPPLELANAIAYQFPQVDGVHFSSLAPGISEAAIHLITSLCSWKPCKRTTAMEALRNPFFQNCFYVPPSLLSKAAIARTTPADTQGGVEQNLGRRNPGNLFNRKPVNNYSPAKSQAYLSPGVQRKLDLNNQNATKADKNLNKLCEATTKISVTWNEWTTGG